MSGGSRASSPASDDDHDLDSLYGDSLDEVIDCDCDFDKYQFTLPFLLTCRQVWFLQTVLQLMLPTFGETLASQAASRLVQGAYDWGSDWLATRYKEAEALAGDYARRKATEYLNVIGDRTRNILNRKQGDLARRALPGIVIILLFHLLQALLFAYLYQLRSPIPPPQAAAPSAATPRPGASSLGLLAGAASSAAPMEDVVSAPASSAFRSVALAEGKYGSPSQSSSASASSASGVHALQAALAQRRFASVRDSHVSSGNLVELYKRLTTRPTPTATSGSASQPSPPSDSSPPSKS